MSATRLIASLPGNSRSLALLLGLLLLGLALLVILVVSASLGVLRLRPWWLLRGSALLVALAGSLVLMGVIVRRLERS